MALNIHSNFYLDNFVKYECMNCRRTFILGEHLSENMNLSCPYCRADDINAIATLNVETVEDMNLGCLGISFHLYDDETLMLYTENEFIQALTEFFADNKGVSIPLGSHNQILKEYCLKRDKR